MVIFTPLNGENGNNILLACIFGRPPIYFLRSGLLLGDQYAKRPRLMRNADLIQERIIVPQQQGTGRQRLSRRPRRIGPSGPAVRSGRGYMAYMHSYVLNSVYCAVSS